MPTRVHHVESTPAMIAHTELTLAALLEQLAAGAVTELVVKEVGLRAYQVHITLPWRDGRSVLVAARGGPRHWRSLDTLTAFLKTAGIGHTLIRLELKP